MTAILKVDTIQDTAGNNIINENANTITIGKAGDTTNIVGTLQNDGAALISGITEADQWRVSATAFFNGSGDITLTRSELSCSKTAKPGERNAATGMGNDGPNPEGRSFLRSTPRNLRQGLTAHGGV